MAKPLRVFVTVGNATQPFDRLLRWADEALAGYPEECEGICQHGASTVRVDRLTNIGTLPKSAFIAALAESDVVLCHGGVGTLLDVMAQGVVPGVATRLARHYEIANDHQLEFVGALAHQQRIHLVAGASDIVRLLLNPPSRVEPSHDEPLPEALVQAFRLKTAMPRWSALRALATLSPALNRLKLRQ